MAHVDEVCQGRVKFFKEKKGWGAIESSATPTDAIWMIGAAGSAGDPRATTADDRHLGAVVRVAPGKGDDPPRKHTPGTAPTRGVGGSQFRRASRPELGLFGRRQGNEPRVPTVEQLGDGIGPHERKALPEPKPDRDGTVVPAQAVPAGICRFATSGMVPGTPEPVHGRNG